jgi:hypothetical protein
VGVIMDRRVRGKERRQLRALVPRIFTHATQYVIEALFRNVVVAQPSP